MKRITRGIVLLALREIAGSTGHLANLAQTSGSLTTDDAAADASLSQLGADLKSCKDQALGLIERLERQEESTHP